MKSYHLSTQLIDPTAQVFQQSLVVYKCIISIKVFSFFEIHQATKTRGAKYVGFRESTFINRDVILITYSCF